jgi:hypothetical protein
MATEKKKELVKKALADGAGVVRLAPCWVPRSFLMPGRRLKLAEEDLYALGADRGGIDERWFCSTTNADNGPGTPEDEGLSYVVIDTPSGPEKVLFRDAIEHMGDAFLGSDVMKQYGGWQLLCKFFDNDGPIPHHMHQMEEHAANVGRKGKPEAYYFPKQLNHTGNKFPYTFFGIEPGTTKEQIINCLKRWNEGDNGILYFSKAYKLKPGTGWDVPAGILHAPGSLVTYEPQKASDVFGMFQSMVEDRPVPRELLTKDVPEDKHFDFSYLIDMLDWEANVDPEFMKHHFREPHPVKDIGEMMEGGYREAWVVYGCDDFCAKELTVFPGKTAELKDPAAYGFIVIEGRGTVGGWQVESPTRIRYGDLTYDEFFVTAEAAERGVKITNTSNAEDLVMLKHFGPGNPQNPKNL